MSFEYSPYILPLIAAVIVSSWALFYVWPHREAKGVRMLVFLAAGVAIWAFGYALEIAGADLTTKLFWGKFQYFGIATIPVAWLFFAFTYTNQSFQLTRRTAGLLTIIPLITLLLTFTTEFHGLVWKEYGIFREGSFSALQLTHGTWFWVYWGYSQLLLLIGTALMFRSLVRERGVFRGQRILFFIAVLAPWIGNILYITGNSPIPYLDLTPFAFTVSVAVLTWAIFGFHLMDIAPVARDLVVDSMREGMVVLDVRGNIVDINIAAARMIGVPVAIAIGKTADSVFHPWSHLVERFRNVLEAKDEISVGDGEAKRRYEVRLSPLQDQQGQLVGRVIMLRAMDDEIPQPRFAASGASQSNIQPQVQAKVSESDLEDRAPKKQNPILGTLVNFYYAPEKKDLAIPSNINPAWHRMRERLFTIILRFAASARTAFFLFTALTTSRLGYTDFVFGTIIVFLWVMGVARNIKYELRVNVFLTLIYCLGFVEMMNYGFSMQSSIFFMTFVIVSAVLLPRLRAIYALAISLATIGIFAVLIDSKVFIPFKIAVDGVLSSNSVNTMATSLLVFGASMSVILVFLIMLLENLNSAWQKESQTSNLLQQERDLLEQRVEERTRETAVVRDEALKNANELRKYFRAIEQSGNTIVITDANGNIEYANPKFEESTGYSITEAKGSTPRILKSGRQSAEYYSQLWKTISAGNIWKGEFLNKRKDGSLYWENATIAPVMGENGTITNYVAVKEDITEQKFLQDQLQKQNDYLSILHQITLDLLNRRELNDLLQVIVDRSAALLDAPFSEIMFGEGDTLVVKAFAENQSSVKGERVTRDQAKLSWQAFDTHQPVVLEDYATWEYRREIYESHPLHATAEFPIMAGDQCLGVLSLGRFIPNYRFTVEQIETGILFARLVALVLDNANLYESAMREIAQRKRTVILLLESEARFRQIVENASDIIYRTDNRGNFTYVNPTSLVMMGFEREEEVLGRNYLDLVVPEFRKKMKRFYDYQFFKKEKSTYYEFPALNTDGEVIWFGQNVRLIEEGNEIIGFQAVARDITQLVKAREALALSRDHALGASQFKSQLLSRVSHELRTPLGGILGYAELLQYKAFGSLTEKQLGAVKNIIESTNYLTRIVNDLLDESQIESKSISLHNEYFNPIELLEKIKNTMSTLADKKELTFRVEIDPDLPSELYGDVNRLQQVIVNLAGNAIKFTKAGEVSVSLKRPAPAQWSIEVRDTGAGISVDEQRNIFEPFRQVNNSITRENRGSGLGLAITKQLIELMGGQISIESEVGKGSLFTVTLPITNAPGE